MQLHQDYEKFREKETEIVTIGPEKATRFEAYFSENNLPFWGLPDENHTVLKRYGQQVKLFKLGRMPAQMLIDQKGILRYVHFGHNMSDIPSNAEMFELIETISD